MLTQRKEGFTPMAIGKWQNVYRRGNLMQYSRDSSKILHTQEVSTDHTKLHVNRPELNIYYAYAKKKKQHDKPR